MINPSKHQDFALLSFVELALLSYKIVEFTKFPDKTGTVSRFIGIKSPSQFKRLYYHKR